MRFVLFHNSQSDLKKILTSGLLCNLLCNLLLPELTAAAGRARVVVVASLLHKRGKMEWKSNLLGDTEKYGDWAGYCNSKLANVLFATEFQRRFGE